MISLIRSWIAPKRKLILIIVVTSMMASVVDVILPYITSVFIDKVLIPKSYETIIMFVQSLIVLFVLDIILKFVNAICFIKLQTETITLAVNYMVNHVVSYPYEHTQNINSGYMAQRISNDVSDYVNFFISHLVTALTAIYLVIGATIYLLKVSCYWLLLFAILLLLYVILYKISQNILLKLSYETRESESTWFNKITFLLTNILPIKIHVLQNNIFKRLNLEFNKWNELNVRRAKFSFWFSNSKDIISHIFTVALFFFGGVMAAKDKISVGEFIALNAYFIMMISGVSAFLNLAQDFQNAKAAYFRLKELLDLPIENDGDKKIESKIRSIEFKDVCYATKDFAIINNFNYIFKTGNIYCITGANGTGKSTLFKLLLGIIKPTSGKIYLNKISSNDIDMTNFREHQVALSDQEPFVHDDVLCDAKINNTLSRYFTLQSERFYDLKKVDAKLSGGEKQKLAQLIFLHEEASIFLLDEPTASIDLEDSENLWKYLNTIKEDKIIIVISHKKAEIQKADFVIKL